MGIKVLGLLAACIGLVAARAVEELPILDHQTRDVLYKVDQPLRLDCGVAGEPGSYKDLKFSWTKNGKPLELSHDVITPEHLKDYLIFLKTSIETEGVYQCYATSDAGTATSGPINVKRTYLEVPRFEPVKLSPLEGAPFQLECPEIKAYPKPKIVWMYQHGLDSSISHTILDPRITSGPDGKLYFSNVTSEDVHKNFKYVCTAKNPAVDEPVSLAEYFLESLKPGDKSGSSPRVPQHVSIDMTAKEGDVTAIYCIYGGTPLISPDWFFNGELINAGPNDRVTDHNRSKGKRLLIRDTKLSDQGIYSCKITEEDGVTSTSIMTLTVVSVPRFVNKPEPRIMAKAGSDVTIPCQIVGVLAPTITWTFNAKPVEINTRYSFANSQQNTDEGVKVISDLVIKNIKKTDKGYYGCKGVNENGVVYNETLLYVL